MKTFSISKKSLIVFVLLGVALIGSSCEDFLQTKIPSKQLPSSSVFSSDVTATSAVTGLYVSMTSTFNSIFNGQMTLWAGLSADELLNTTGNASQGEFFNSAVNPANDQLKTYFWNPAYNYIYQCNSILEGLSKSKAITPSVSTQLEGEVRVIRAMSHFYLVNYFGEVPYITTTDYKQNTFATRKAVVDVYTGIIGDLTTAQTMLADSYPTSGRTRINKAVASAFLARVYLYTQDWSKTEIEATKAITNSNYSLLTDLTKIFLANSTETIWQLFPTAAGMNTAEGNRFAQTSGVPLYADISPALLAAFEVNDKRKVNWITQYTFSGKAYSLPSKYKVRTGSTITEYYMVLRLAEQYLIRAEARARQGKLTQAISDLDAVRSRAGITLIQTTNPGISQSNLLLAIEQERRVELFCEWGHRWLDLKRTDRINAVMQAAKPSTWKSTGALFPLPLSELLINPNLTQNPGY